MIKVKRMVWFWEIPCWDNFNTSTLTGRYKFIDDEMFLENKETFKRFLRKDRHEYEWISERHLDFFDEEVFECPSIARSVT